MENNIISNYKNRINTYSSYLEKVNKKVKFIPMIRLVEVIAGFVICYFTYKYSHEVVFILLILFLALFLYLIKLHAKLKERKVQLEYLIQINNKHRFSCIFFTPNFQDVAAPIKSKDIFSNHSYFDSL